MYGLVTFLGLVAADVPKPTPEERAVAFLACEVPNWRVKNGCYSCHNNGDAARALMAAARASFAVPPDALRDTLEWLSQPGEWDHNRGDERFSDKAHARIQFGAALLDARAYLPALPRDRLSQAAALLVQDQQPAGFWKAGQEGSVGSPITYGPILATHFARSALRQAADAKYADALKRADRWLREQQPKSIVDAASLLLALADDREWPIGRRDECLALIRKGQDRDGGWGPFLTTGSQVFDTALVLLALVKVPHADGRAEMLRRGRAYLLATQEADGGWPATTRPAGVGSYAHRISTSGWALLALLATK